MRSGFTLVEILMVVLIMGITSAMAIPYMVGRSDQKVASAAREMTADILFAQNEAIAQQTMYYVHFDTTNNKYSVLSALPSTIITHPVTKNPYTVVFGVNAGPTGLTDCSLNSVNFDGKATLAFDWLGAPYSVNDTTGAATALASGSIVVQSGSATQTVSVDAITGQVEVH
jgi:prepilin-type N-terminal cleavage/methylation domain-containing protein